MDISTVFSGCTVVHHIDFRKPMLLMVRERPQTRASHTVRVSTSSWASTLSARRTFRLSPAEACLTSENSGSAGSA
eukprot:730949-Alexandrium_andersonii.AAC.1